MSGLSLIVDGVFDAQNAPIVYVHPGPDAPPRAVLIDAEHWTKITDLLPESEEVTALLMRHGHYEDEL